MTMTPELKDKLRKLLIKHEGWKNFPYTDTVGKLTIGCGYNLTDRGLPDSWIKAQLDEDILYFYDQLNSDFLWFKELNDARQMVLVDMCFMGYRKFKTFKRMLRALEDKNYHLAANELLDSVYARQVPSRAQELAKVLLTGSINT